MTPASRRQLSKDLSRIADAPIEDVLSFPESDWVCPVVGITGPPGAGKSTLIGNLAQLRANTCEEGMAVIAIDPTSPLSGGAILGDRIRMAELADNPRVYIRSIATRGSVDGLADNLPILISRMARESFAEIVLETTGVGQVEFAVRQFADTMLLVLTPGSGDSIQAMKSGIMEMPDIFVVNKSDQPGALQLANDIKSVVRSRAASSTDWIPPVVMTAGHTGDGIEVLSAEIDAHRAALPPEQGNSRCLRLRINLVRSLLARRSEELLREIAVAEQPLAVSELFEIIAHRLPFTRLDKNLR